MAEIRSAKVIPVLLHYKNYFVMFYEDLIKNLFLVYF